MRTLTPLSFDPCRSHSWDLDSVVDQLSWKRFQLLFKMTSGLISGDFTYRHQVEPRVKLYIPKEDRSVAKSKSTAMNLSSHVPTSSSSAKSLLKLGVTVKKM